MYMHYRTLEEYTENSEVTCLSGKGARQVVVRVGCVVLYCIQLYFIVCNFGLDFFKYLFT